MIMVLAQVRYRDRWMVGQLVDGLPPPKPPEPPEAAAGDEEEDDVEAPAAPPIVLRDCVDVMQTMIPVEGETISGTRVGFMPGDALLEVPLPCDVVIEYGNAVPPYGLFEVDTESGRYRSVHTGQYVSVSRGAIARYLAMVKAWAAAEATELQTAGDGGGPPKEDQRRRVRLTS